MFGQNIVHVYHSICSTNAVQCTALMNWCSVAVYITQQWDFYTVVSNIDTNIMHYITGCVFSYV